MFKRVISIALAVVMLFAMAVVAVSAAEVSDSAAGADVSNSAGADTSGSSTGAGNYVYFNPTGWKNVSSIYCHIWEIGGEEFFSWGSKKEMCKKESDTKYYYDLSYLTNSTTIKGGLKDGVDYGIIFYANANAPQTYDLTFSTACAGDTAKITGKMIENAVDSEKEGYEAVWTTNSSKYGPHLAISSIGNIIGSKLCPGESGAEVIGNWLPTYYNHTNFDVVGTLAKALPKFGVKDIQAVYSYILASKADDVAFAESDFATMQKQLEEAYAKAYPSAKATKINKSAAEKTAKKIEGGADVDDLSTDTPSGGASGGNSQAGGTTTSTNSSGSGADGQNDTILFVLAGVMLAAAGAMFLSRRKREE